MLLIDERPIEYSAEWKGPVKRRSCTDTSWFLIFTVFLAGWIVMGYYTVKYSDVRRMFVDDTPVDNTPVDSWGRKCGLNYGVENAPYLVFFDLTKCLNAEGTCHTPQVCREKCPDENWYYDFLWDLQSVEYIRKHMICELGVNVTTKGKSELKKLIEVDEVCAKWYLESTPIMGRCIPEKIPLNDTFLHLITERQLKNAKIIILSNNPTGNRELLGNSHRNSDIIDIWIVEGKTILVFIAYGAAICFIYLILLRWLAFEFTLMAAALLCVFYSFVSYYFSQLYEESNGTFELILCIVFGILAALIALIVLLLWTRIKAACQLIKESSIAVVSIPSSILYPILPSVLHLAAVVFFVVNIVGLYSSETLGWETWEYVLHLMFNLIGFLWFYFFVTALSQMILAFVFASWYWTFDKRNVPSFTLFISIGKTIRYHLGTVAFGSLLVTICRFIRILLTVMKYCRGDGAAFFRIIACLMLCFIQAFERFLKFMNRNAYIVCAIYGEGLRNSASVALSLIIRNVDRVIILNNIVSWVLWLGKVLITIVMGLWATWYYFPKGVDWTTPVVTIVIGTWLIASLFFSVFRVAVDTIFLCFLEDIERNDGTSARPYYMSRKLRKVLQMESE